MCGLTGFFETKAPRERSEASLIVRNMLDCLTHRGPDFGDIWLDPEESLTLGHRRLSIIDLSPEGNQPMHSGSGRFVMVYNGEIYNYPELQSELKDKGIAFHGCSDSETLLEAIDYWGLDKALQKINGMFAFVIWDRKDRILHFARDRMGKKPLYIGWARNTLVFSSELKAIAAHPDFKKEINRFALYHYLNRGYVSAPFSIYQNMWQIPSGQTLSLEMKNLAPGSDLSKSFIPYWNPVQSMKHSRGSMRDESEEHIVDEFENILQVCVSDRMISDVPLGAFLSGGIDSSVVVAMMQRASDAPVKTYTIGFEEAGFDEAVYAKKVAAHLGTDHHELYLDVKSARDIIPALPDMYDEPFADSSAIPTYIVSKFARESVTVALSGDGGDEMLGGYMRHIAGPKIWNFMRFTPKALRRQIAKQITSIPTERWNKWVPVRPHFGHLMHKTASIIDLDSQDDVFRQISALWPCPPMVFPENDNLPEHSLEDQALLNFPSGDIETMSFAERMMLWDTMMYLPGDILTKVDRASMAVSLEVRAPLLDRRIYEYVWSLPAHFKIRGGKGKYLLRETLRRHVPSKLFERPKQGFSIPVGEWIRGDLKDWAETLLDEKALREDGVFNTDVVRETWQHHLNGHGKHTERLWAVLMFQAWQDRWM